ncbi:hypothetical protein M758_8G050100 [Ceratodon purpureus]|nr:hypothetical protein M758_8G050100 [Ceratodon purpureus]
MAVDSMCAESVKAEEALANANAIASANFNDALMLQASAVAAPQAPVLTTLDVNTPIDGGSNRKRAVQHVSTRATRKAVVKWMIEDEAINGKKLLISRAVKAFPEHFFGADKSNLQKASCWWKRREEILEDDDDEHDPEVTCRVRVSSRGSLKARAGRGRKRAARIIRAPVLGVLDAKRARRGRVTNHGSKNGKRALQHVSTMATRKAVVSWMIEDEAVHGEKCLISRTVKAFPEHFCGNDKANLAKVSRWWKARDEILQDDEEDDDPEMEHSLVLVSNRPQVRLKARAGRGRKRAAWVNWLHTQLLEETDRLRKTGVKVSPKLLQEIACHILRMSNSDFTEKTLDPKDGVPIVQKITPQWIQGFMNRTKATKTPKDKMVIDS